MFVHEISRMAEECEVDAGREGGREVSLAPMLFFIA